MKRMTAALRGSLSRVMRTKPAQRILAPVIPRVQLLLFHASGGKIELSAILVPSLTLVTKGAKSGLRRETPLMCLLERNGSLLVAGSNFGRESHPAWTANLLAHPRAEITRRGKRHAVTAELLSAAETEAVWPRLERQWPGYREYERVSGRDIRVFRLTPHD